MVAVRGPTSKLGACGIHEIDENGDVDVTVRMEYAHRVADAGPLVGWDRLAPDVRVMFHGIVDGVGDPIPSRHLSTDPGWISWKGLISRLKGMAWAAGGWRLVPVVEAKDVCSEIDPRNGPSFSLNGSTCPGGCAAGLHAAFPAI